MHIIYIISVCLCEQTNTTESLALYKDTEFQLVIHSFRYSLKKLCMLSSGGSATGAVV